MRIATELTEPFSDKQIPFYYLSELGRHETIRGFGRGRFRANDMILASLEYRYPIWRRIDATFFVDTGKVSNNLADEFNTDNLEVTFGAGLRLFNRNGLILKTEFGRSDDGVRYYFSLNQGL